SRKLDQAPSAKLAELAVLIQAIFKYSWFIWADRPTHIIASIGFGFFMYIHKLDQGKTK
ncbi:MAG: hypothetical protein RIR36_1104, partial [Bacteroidota bacterium]